MTSPRTSTALFALGAVVLCTCSALLTGCCAFVRYPESGGEAIVHLLEGEMTVACERRLPQSVRGDFDRFRQAVMALPLENRRGGFSPCGRMFLAFEEARKQRIDAIKGVWIWPDWRDAQSVLHIDDAWKADFLGGPYVMLWELDRGLVMDVRRPQARWECPREFASIAITERGRWLAVTGQGDVQAGFLKEGDPVLGGDRWDEREPVYTLAWANDGRHVLVTYQDAAIQVLSAEGALVSERINGLWFQMRLSRSTFICRDACFGGVRMVRVAEDGRLLPGARYLWRPFLASPSGKYVLCWTDFWLPAPGMVDVAMRRTTVAKASDPLSLPIKNGGAPDWIGW